MGFDADLDVFLALLSGEADLAINKTGEALNPVEDGLNVELDGWPPWLSLDNRLETRSDDRIRSTNHVFSPIAFLDSMTTGGE